MPKKINLKRIRNLLGWIFGVYPLLSAIRDLRSLQDFKAFLSERIVELKGILDFIANLFHFILLPWEKLKAILVAILPLNIPADWYDSIFIASIVMLIPLRYFVIKTNLNKQFDGWKYFKTKIYPFIKAKPPVFESREFFDKIIKLFEKENFIYIFSNLAGPTLEYIFLFLYNNPRKILEEKQTLALSHIDSLDKLYKFSEHRVKKYFRNFKIQGVLFGLVLVIISVDKVVYFPENMSSFIITTLIISLALPVLIFIILLIFGIILIVFLRKEVNPVKRARVYDFIENGFFGHKKYLRKYIGFGKVENAGVMWGDKFSQGQTIVSFLPAEVNKAREYTYGKGKKVRISYWFGIKNFYYKTSLASIVPILFNNKSVEKTTLKLYPVLKLFKKELDFKPLDFLMASDYYRYKGNINEACILLENCIKRYKDFYRAYIKLATLKFIREDFDQVIKLSRSALRIRPISSEARNLLAEVYVKKGDFQNAIEEYDIILNRVDESPNVWTNKGLVYLIIKQHDDAVNCFDKALHFMPNNLLALQGRGKALAYLKHYEQSFKDLDKSLKIKPNDISSLYHMALCKFSLQDFNGAYINILYAEQIEPETCIIQHLKGQIEFALDKKEAGLLSMQKAHELNPNDNNNINFLGLAYYYSGEYKKAIEYFEMVLEKEPNNHDAIVLRATVYLVTDKLDLGIEENKKACKINKNSRRCLLNYGIFYLKKGNYEESREYLEKALNQGMVEAKDWLKHINSKETP